MFKRFFRRRLTRYLSIGVVVVLIAIWLTLIPVGVKIDSSGFLSVDMNVAFAADSIDLQVSAIHDDACLRVDTDEFLNEATRHVLDYSTRTYYNWVRFVNDTAIPSGATIIAAYLTFTAYDDDASGSSVRIYGLDVDDVGDFGDKETTKGYAVTTAYTDWSPGAWTADTEYNTDDLSDEVQEIVDLMGGIAIGEHIGFKTMNTAQTVMKRSHAYAGSTTKCVKLHIEFEEGVDITNTPSSFDFGTVYESSIHETGLTYFGVTNNSGAAVDIAISGTDMTGGVTWTLSDTATPGSNTVGFMAGGSSSEMALGFSGDTSLSTLGFASDTSLSYVGMTGEGYTVIVKKNPPYNDLVTSLADSATHYWGLRMYTPTAFTDGVQKSGPITLTATLS